MQIYLLNVNKHGGSLWTEKNRNREGEKNGETHEKKKRQEWYSKIDRVVFRTEKNGEENGGKREF